MNIQKLYLKFADSLIERAKTDYIVVHHTAAVIDYTVNEIHDMHINNGWSGIGYHFYIRKNGDIFEGRPCTMIGAHAEGYNYRSISVCLSGNFEVEKPTKAQIASLAYMLEKLKTKYPNAIIAGHRELNSTACPGANLFPYVQEMAFDSKKRIEYASECSPSSDSIKGKIFAHGGKLCVAIGQSEYEVKADSVAFKIKRNNSDDTVIAANAKADNGKLIITAGNDEFFIDSEMVIFEISKR